MARAARAGAELRVPLPRGRARAEGAGQDHGAHQAGESSGVIEPRR